MLATSFVGKLDRTKIPRTWLPWKESLQFHWGAIVALPCDFLTVEVLTLHGCTFGRRRSLGRRLGSLIAELATLELT